MHGKWQDVDAELNEYGQQVSALPWITSSKFNQMLLAFISSFVTVCGQWVCDLRWQLCEMHFTWGQLGRTGTIKIRCLFVARRHWNTFCACQVCPGANFATFVSTLKWKHAPTRWDGKWSRMLNHWTTWMWLTVFTYLFNGNGFAHPAPSTLNSRYLLRLESRYS